MISNRVMAALVLLGLSGQIAWAVENQYFNTFMYNHITPDPQPVSWMVAITAVVSTVTTILMGAVSDRTSTRWGRRKPFIFVGYIAWGIFTALYPLSATFRPVMLAVTMAILFDCVMTFCGSTANDASFNAYLTDVTTVENRGRIVSVQQILLWISMLIVFGGAGFIPEQFAHLPFYIVGALVIGLGMVGSFLIAEPPFEPVCVPFWEQLSSTFRIANLKTHGEFFLLATATGLWGLAFNVFYPFLLIYLQHNIALPMLTSSLLVFVAILVGGIALAYPFGILTDRWGRKRVALLSVALESIFLLAFSFCRNFIPLALTGIGWLAAITAWSIATGVWLKDLFPEDKRGQFAGYGILFGVAFTMIPGPLVGGWLSSTYGIPATIDGQAGIIPPSLVFRVAAGLILLAALPLFRLREPTQQEPEA